MYVRLDPSHAGLFRFLLEARGHLGLAATIDPAGGVLCLRFAPGAEPDAAAFLEQAGREIPLTVFDPFDALSRADLASPVRTT